MSRRPQILHITDSINSRQRNRTYTKNTVVQNATVAKNGSGIRKGYDISDWETYSVLPARGERDETGMDTVDLGRPESPSYNGDDDMSPSVEHTYATINKKRPTEREDETRVEHDEKQVAKEVNLVRSESKKQMKEDPIRTLDPLKGRYASEELKEKKHKEEAEKLEMERKEKEEVKTNGVYQTNAKEESKETAKEPNIEIESSEEIQVPLCPPMKVCSEMEKLKEMNKVENKGIDSSMEKIKSETKITTLIKERSQSLLNLNSEQTEKIKFKKLGSKIESQINKFKKKKDNLDENTEGSINRSMPEFLNENFAIENPLIRFKAIENHLENISRRNNGKVQNTRKGSLDKVGYNVNAHQKVERSQNSINKPFVAEQIEKSNNLNINTHEKVTKTKSNDESNASNYDKFRKVAAFDGLIQYLQDYRLGLRELLVNNNVVIIEPVRESSVRLEDEKGFKRDMKTGSLESGCRITGATIKKVQQREDSHTLPRQPNKHQPKIKRHFFYHPCNKVNRYLVDKELPDPDLVKSGREKYEEFLKLKIQKEKILAGYGHETLPGKPVEVKYVDVPRPTEKSFRSTADSMNKRKLCRFLTVDTVYRDKVIKRWTDSGSLSSGISSDLSCYDTDLESPNYDMKTHFSSDDDDEDFDSFNSKNFEVEYHYVAPEVLEKIRACGESTTYYGGRIVASTKGPSPMNCIMNEIQEDTKVEGLQLDKNYLGVKFRLVKSNSCGSRLELAGTDDEKVVKKERPLLMSCQGKNSEHDSNKDLGTGMKRIDKSSVDEGISNKPLGKIDARNTEGGKRFGDKCESKPKLVIHGYKSNENLNKLMGGGDLPKIDIQKVIKEMEAKKYDKVGAHNKDTKVNHCKVDKTLTMNGSQTQKQTAFKAATQVYKDMIVRDAAAEMKSGSAIKEQKSEDKTETNKNKDTKKPILIVAKVEEAKPVNTVQNFPAVTPGSRGANLPKVLLSAEKSKNRPHGFSAPVCDMEFETFEVLGSAGSAEVEEDKQHVCEQGTDKAVDDVEKAVMTVDVTVKAAVGEAEPEKMVVVLGGHQKEVTAEVHREEEKEEAKEGSKEGESDSSSGDEKKVRMTSWATQQSRL